MNTSIFLFSGGDNLSVTLLLILATYFVSPSKRSEIYFGKLFGLIISIYPVINLFYYLKLIPPLPLALDDGLVAHQIRKENNPYVVTHEKDEPYIFLKGP